MTIAAIAIDKIDHVAVTSTELEVSTRFYCQVLGAQVVHDFIADGAIIAKQLRIGRAMLNIHQVGHGHSLVAARPTPGAIDLCFGWANPIEDAIELLEGCGVEIIEGPVLRRSSSGAEGLSVYFRDPDGNLLELLSLFANEQD